MVMQVVHLLYSLLLMLLLATPVPSSRVGDANRTRECAACDAAGEGGHRRSSIDGPLTDSLLQRIERIEHIVGAKETVLARRGCCCCCRCCSLTVPCRPGS
uniref:Putative secreted protein n=1 Tax=Anopheles marajoara TaxID=58244 RepID=A0A2M4C8S7_9DIPT